MSKSTNTSFSTRQQSIASSISSKPSECVREDLASERGALREIGVEGATQKPNIECKVAPQKLDSTSADSEKHSNMESISSEPPHKKERSLSTTSSQTSVRKGCKADAMSDVKSDFKSSSNVEIKIALHDKEQFPSLEPARSPASSIVDGRRPPPPPKGPVNYSTVAKKQVKPVVPRNLVPRSGSKP
jgi:hypothetical protein